MPPWWRCPEKFEGARTRARLVSLFRRTAYRFGHGLGTGFVLLDCGVQQLEDPSHQVRDNGRKCINENHQFDRIPETLHLILQSTVVMLMVQVRLVEDDKDLIGLNTIVL